MSLSGRTQAHPARRERKIARRARGAPPPTRHGPLQARVRGLLSTYLLAKVQCFLIPLLLKWVFEVGWELCSVLAHLGQSSVDEWIPLRWTNDSLVLGKL